MFTGQGESFPTMDPGFSYDPRNPDGGLGGGGRGGRGGGGYPPYFGFTTFDPSYFNTGDPSSSGRGIKHLKSYLVKGIEK